MENVQSSDLLKKHLKLSSFMNRFFFFSIESQITVIAMNYLSFFSPPKITLKVRSKMLPFSYVRRNLKEGGWGEREGVKKIFPAFIQKMKFDKGFSS
jgi:hypothetical protein